MAFSIETVTARLQSLGYTVSEGDMFSLTFCMSKVEEHIKNFCNITAVPEGLEYAAVDMVCGEFLAAKKAYDPDSLTGFDFDAALKSIQEGDTNVTYALGEGSSTSESRFDALVTGLIHGYEADLIAYRRLRW